MKDSGHVWLGDTFAPFPISGRGFVEESFPIETGVDSGALSQKKEKRDVLWFASFWFVSRKASNGRHSSSGGS